MTDKEFLSWIYDRMIYKHGENKNVDYMLKFRSIIDSLQEEPVSEDLDRAAEKYAYELFPSIGAANTETELAFKAGADWGRSRERRDQRRRLHNARHHGNERTEIKH